MPDYDHNKIKPEPEHPDHADRPGDDIARQIKELHDRLKTAEERLKEIPTAAELGHEWPVHRVETDKYIRYQLDQGNLTLMLNTDELKRSPFGAAPGLTFAGFCQIESQTDTGIVDARGNPVQWLYSITQVQKGGPGYGDAAWDDVVNGYVGNARNMCENGNTGIGVQDNGVNFDAADFPDGFEMIPLRGTLPFFLMTNEDGSTEAWLDRCNAVDGPCSGSY